uniref:Uncharacterized protein n=1 Tax=Magallana gigas TaxID=29159 RepID=A0A8W8NWD5_MAGGI
MAPEGSKRVEIAGLGNKRRITAVFAGTLSDYSHALDVSVQKAVKNHLRKSFEDWHSNQIVAQLKDGEDSDVSPVELTMSKLKPLSATWLVQMYQHISNSPDIIRNGFKETGIANTLKAHLKDEIPLARAFTK